MNTACYSSLAVNMIVHLCLDTEGAFFIGIFHSNARDDLH